MADKPRKEKIVTTKEVVVTLPVVKAPRWIQGFIDFIREQGVVGLAVGLVLGAASKSVIDSLVNNIFNPVLGLLTGGGNLAAWGICLKSANGQCTNFVSVGKFLNDIISFLLIAAVVYFVIKGLKLDKLDKKKPE